MKFIKHIKSKYEHSYTVPFATVTQTEKRTALHYQITSDSINIFDL